MLHCVGIIPARYYSSRLPGKPLALIEDKPLIQHVWERASKSQTLDSLLVATDDERIMQAVKEFGGECMLTSPDAPTGTDRVAEAVRNIDTDVVINIQGDEPFISPMLIDDLAGVFDDLEVLMATPVRKSDAEDDLNDSNSVKVVFDNNGNAIYFSRSPIPFYRDNADAEDSTGNGGHHWIHIGLYGYRKEFLLDLPTLSQTPLELAENLEQLRVIEHGFPIRVIQTEFKSVPVDTPEDLEIAADMYRKQFNS